MKRLLTAVLVLGAVVCVVIAVIYLTNTAKGLPSFFPGHNAHSIHKHVKHGIAFIGLAVVALLGAWFAGAPNKANPDHVNTSESSR